MSNPCLHYAFLRGAVQRITNVLDGQAAFQATELELTALLRGACQVHRDATRGVIINEDCSSLSAIIHGDPKNCFFTRLGI